MSGTIYREVGVMKLGVKCVVRQGTVVQKKPQGLNLYVGILSVGELHSVVCVVIIFGMYIHMY